MNGPWTMSQAEVLGFIAIVVLVIWNASSSHKRALGPLGDVTCGFTAQFPFSKRTTV
jgi:hypothetical protein